MSIPIGPHQTPMPQPPEGPYLKKAHGQKSFSLSPKAQDPEFKEEISQLIKELEAIEDIEKSKPEDIKESLNSLLDHTESEVQRRFINILVEKFGSVKFDPKALANELKKLL